MADDTYVITKDDIDSMAGQPKAHFLNDNARCQSKSLSEQTGLTGFGFHIIEVQPGRDTTELHMHYNEDECVFILSGNGTATIGDDILPVSQGDFLGYRKGGLAHTIRNTGTEVLRCIVVGNRNDSDVVDYPAARKRIFRTTGLGWKVADLADLTDRPIVPKPYGVSRNR